MRLPWTKIIEKETRIINGFIYNIDELVEKVEELVEKVEELDLQLQLSKNMIALTNQKIRQDQDLFNEKKEALMFAYLHSDTKSKLDHYENKKLKEMTENYIEAVYLETIEE